MGWYKYTLEWFDESSGKYVKDDWFNTFISAVFGAIKLKRYHKIVRLTFRYRGGNTSGR